MLTTSHKMVDNISKMLPARNIQKNSLLLMKINIKIISLHTHKLLSSRFKIYYAGSYLMMPGGLQCSIHWFPPPVNYPSQYDPCC